MKATKRLFGLLILPAMTVAVSVGAVTMPTHHAQEVLGAAAIGHDHSGYTEWTSTNSLPTSAGSYYLADNVTITSTWEVPGAVNLCLNGHSITKTGSTGSVFRLGGTGDVFNLYECDKTTHYYYIDESESGHNLGVVVDSLEAAQAGNPNRNGTFVGGYITGGRGNYYASNYRGGCMIIEGGGSFNFYGGTMIGNAPNFSNSGQSVGAIFAPSGNITIHDGAYIIGNYSVRTGGVSIDAGSLTMDGGVIADNTASEDGGALSVGVSTSITGGKIFRNRSMKNNIGGGAILASAAPGVFHLGGDVEISGNMTEGFGGGVNVLGFQNWWETTPASGSISISGNLKIHDNVAKHGGDTYVPDNLYIMSKLNTYCSTKQAVILEDALGEEARIGVNMDDGCGLILGDWVAKMKEADPADYFFCDDVKCHLFVDENGDPNLVKHHGGYTKWTSETSLPTSEGNYYLAHDVTLTGKWSAPAGTTNICLDGHFIRQTSNACVVEAIGSNRVVNIYDCDETIHYYYIDPTTRLGVVVDSEEAAIAGNPDKHGSFTGGYLTGGRGRNRAGTLTAGGGIFQESSSNVTLENVTLIGNHGDFGGAVHNTDSTITFRGGYIIGNTGAGSAVNMDKNNKKNSYAHFYDTIITHNDSGLRNCGTSMTLSGKLEIFDNDNKGDGSGYDLQPSSLYVIGETLENTHPFAVSHPDSAIATFTSGLSGKGDASNFTCTNPDYYIKVNDSGEATFAPTPLATVTDGETVNEYADLSSALAAWGDGMTLTLRKNVTGQITVAEGTKTLDLNDHVLSPVNADSTAVTVTGGSLQIVDSSAGTTRYYLPNNEGVASLSTTETDNSFKGGYIGGAVGRAIVVTGGEVTLSSGTLFGNDYNNGSSGREGAGVYIGPDGRFILEGTGAIIGNHAGRSTGVAVYGTFDMKGGLVRHNTALFHTGGMCVWGGGSLHLSGGEISGNYGHSWPASGIYMDGNGGIVSLSGNPKVYDNYCLTVEKNLGISPRKAISLSGPLTEGARIEAFFYLDNNEAKQLGQAYTLIDNWSAVMGEADPYDYFPSVPVMNGDNLLATYESYVVDGKAVVSPIDFLVHFNANSGTGTMDDAHANSRFYALPDNGFTAPDGYRFLGWKWDVDGKMYSPGAKFFLSGGTSFTAVWGRNPDKDWLILSGTIYAEDGTTPISGATVKLAKGNEVFDFTTTGIDGAYEFDCPNGPYNLIVESAGQSKTILVEVNDATVKDIVFGEAKTESILVVDESLGVAVGGLDEEAEAIRKAEEIPANQYVGITMNVEAKTEETAPHAEEIAAEAAGQRLEFYDIKVEKTVGETKTALENTESVIEVIVPYKNIEKRGISVYTYHGEEVKTYVEATTKAAGTYIVDKEIGAIRIYTNEFSPFAIAYTPYFDIKATITLGSYEGNVTAKLEDKATKEVIETLTDVKMSEVSFKDLLAGEYLLSITWTDGASNTITMPITISE